MSDITENTVKSAKIDSYNISAYVSLAYDSLREVLEALCIMNGYKVVSHICMGELLMTLIDDFAYSEFDRLRWTRNSINYYGKKIQYNQGLMVIKKIFSMKHEILTKYLKNPN